MVLRNKNDYNGNISQFVFKIDGQISTYLSISSIILFIYENNVKNTTRFKFCERARDATNK